MGDCQRHDNGRDSIGFRLSIDERCGSRHGRPMQERAELGFRVSNTTKPLVLLLWLVIVVLTTNQALAQGTCISQSGSNSWNHPTPLHGNLKYRIRVQDAAAFGLSASELRAATMLALDSWNNQGNGRSFTYLGTTTKKASDYIGSTAATCTTDGVDYSIVDFEDVAEGAYMATARPICCTGGACNPGPGVGKHFAIRVPRRPSGCAPGPGCDHNFGNGFTGASIDLPGLLVHESGHVGGIAHSATNPVEASVMATTSAAGHNKNPNYRALWEYDFKCSGELSGRRQASGYRVTDTAGTLGTPTKFTGTLPIAKTMVGLGASGGWATTYHRGTRVSFSPTNNATYEDFSTADVAVNNGSGFSLGLWREDTTIDRVLYSEWTDSTKYAFNSRHRVRHMTSDDDFATYSPNGLSRCVSMSGWACSGTSTGVYSAGVPSSAWWDGGGTNNRTVVAWTNQDRSGSGTGSEANKIYISVGYVSKNVVAQPTMTDIRAAAPPAVTCKNNFSSSWDCILFYIPFDSLSTVFRARRFSISGSGSGMYTVAFESNSVGIDYASSSPSAWYISSTNRFYVAFRTALDGQKLRVWRSTSAAATAWEFVVDIDDTVTAPSVASVLHATNNRIVYVKY